MKAVAIVQHQADDNPAYLATFLERAGIAYCLFRPDLGEALPGSIRDYAGYALLGGNISVNDQLSYQSQEMALIVEAIAADIPVIGHCLGGQLMAKALGAEVSSAPYPEIGWQPLHPLHAAAHDWFGRTTPWIQFQWHKEMFALPPNARLLARSQYCEHQAFDVNAKHLAMQFHCEVNAAKVRAWLSSDTHDFYQCAGPGVQTTDRVLTQLEDNIVISQQIADAIYTRWSQGLSR